MVVKWQPKAAPMVIWEPKDGADGEIAFVGMIILMVRCCVHQSMLCFLVPS